MNTYGVGIWGAGVVAEDHMAAYLAQPDCRIVAIGSLFLSDAEALAERFGVQCACYTDYNAFLAQPGLDIVSVCTPHYLHASNTIAAAQAGKHVFVEKPLAVTLADLYSMRQAVLDAGVCTITGFVVRWIPLVARLGEMVHSGELGKVRVVDVDYWHSRRRPAEFRNRATGGSAMLLGGCHAVDTAIFLTNAQPVEVVARSVQIGADPDDMYEFDCAELCLVRYSSGAIGRISAVVKGHMPYQFNIDLLGDGGCACNNRVFLQDDTEETGFRVLTDPGIEQAKATGLPYQELVLHFINCIRSGSKSGVSVENATLAHEVCFAAMLSERTGRFVNLPLSVEDQLAIHNLLERETSS